MEGNLAIAILMQQAATWQPSKATKACTAAAATAAAILPLAPGLGFAGEDGTGSFVSGKG